MMNTYLYFISSILIAVFFALLEIQIEGENGWAGKLPTWRINKDWMKYLLLGQGLTGYHLNLWIFIFLLGHLIFVYVPWNLKLEITICSQLLLIGFIEDFLWFMFNPSYGLKKFKKENIWWHKSWLLGIPISYYWAMFFWLALFILGVKI